MLSFDAVLPADRAPRLLCLGAHADDIEIGCGGTLLRLLEAYPNAVVCWVVFSASDVRAAEARTAAARVLGRTEKADVRICRFRDGFFPSEHDAIKQYFEDELKGVAPDLVFTHYRHDRHQDHRVLSDLAWNTFRDTVILEYEILKYDGDLGTPSLFVPLSPEVCEHKIEVLLDAFVSQRDKHWFDAETFRAMMRVRGVEAATRYAEAFYARKLRWM